MKPPAIIDHRYKVLKTLGEGKRGLVLLAKKSDQRVVIKLLNNISVLNPAKTFQTFKREFLTLKKLNHPYIGKLYDFGFEPYLKRYYFSGEYINGEDIYKACSRKSMVEDCEKLFVQALQALHYLHTYHGAGLRHNDIKLSNIMVTQKPTGAPSLKMIDFGLASFAPLPIRGGTPLYMAPEQIALTFPALTKNGKYPKPDHRADLYSLGVVWYLCLTGTNPFSAKDYFSVLKRHLHFIPEAPSSIKPEIPAYLDKIILKLLKKDPTERYTNATEVIHELNLLSGKFYPVIPSVLRQYYLPTEWIGRQRAWHSLKSAWDHLCKEHPSEPSIIQIVGERGQGKTELIKHFKNYAQVHGGRVLFLNKEKKEALEEWLTLLDQHTKDFSESLIIAIDDADTNPAAMKAVNDLCQKICFAKHWNTTTPIRWLFVLSTQTKTKLKMHVNLHHVNIALNNFDTNDLKGLFKTISPFKRDVLPDTFLKKLKNHTHGNPLFIFSTLKTLVEDGFLFDDRGHWHPTLFQDVIIHFDRLSIPQNMKEALQEDRRLLNPQELAIANFISCWETAPKEETIFKIDPNISSQSFALLIQKGILEKDKKNRIQFKNGFFKRAVYGHIAPHKKAELHNLIASHIRSFSATSSQELLFNLSRGSNQRKRNEALESLGKRYLERAQFEGAIEAFRKRLQFKQYSDQKSLLETAHLLTQTLIRVGHFQEAKKIIALWLPKAVSCELFLYRALLFHELGLIHWKQNRVGHARKHLMIALKHIEHTRKYFREKIIIKNDIAKTFVAEGKLDEAIALYLETRKHPESISNRITNNDLGYCYFLKHKGDLAKTTLEEDAKLLQNGPDKTRLARCHYLLGEVLRRFYKNFNGAAKHYQLSEKIARDLKDTERVMRAYHGLATTYLDRAHAGDQANAYPQALRYFEQSLVLISKIKKDLNSLNTETAAIYLCIAMVHQEQGKFQKAKDIYQNIIKVLESDKSKNHSINTRLCEAYIALADTLVSEQKWHQADICLTKANYITQKTNDLHELKFGIQLLQARVSVGLGETQKARRFLAFCGATKKNFKIEPTPTSVRYLSDLRNSLEPQSRPNELGAKPRKLLY